MNDIIKRKRYKMNKLTKIVNHIGFNPFNCSLYGKFGYNKK